MEQYIVAISLVATLATMMVLLNSMYHQFDTKIAAAIKENREAREASEKENREALAANSKENREYVIARSREDRDYFISALQRMDDKFVKEMREIRGELKK